MHLSRWAEQWIIYMTTEFGFIKIADRYTTSSSMMPQKRNPDMLELIRGRCGNVYGDLFALMTILKGLPIGYNRDLQEDKRIVFRAYDTVSGCLTMAAAIVNSASYDKERIEPTLERGFLDATSLAEYLVTKGVPFRTAHHIVGTLVAPMRKGREGSLGELKIEKFKAAVKAQGAGVGIGKDIYDALRARNVVKRYQSAGLPAASHSRSSSRHGKNGSSSDAQRIAECGASSSVGSSGDGKTTLASALAQRLRVPHVEIDSLNWESNWTETPTDMLWKKIESALAGDAWAVCGNYTKLRELIWPRADTLIWLDYPMGLVMWQVLRRTVRRCITQEMLWATNNVESWRKSFFRAIQLLCGRGRVGVRSGETIQSSFVRGNIPVCGDIDLSRRR